LHAHVPVLLTRIIIGPRAVSDEAHDTARTSPDSYRGNNRRNSTPPSPPLGSSSLMLSRFLVSSVAANRERRHTYLKQTRQICFTLPACSPLRFLSRRRSAEERRGAERSVPRARPRDAPMRLLRAALNTKYAGVVLVSVTSGIKRY